VGNQSKQGGQHGKSPPARQKETEKLWMPRFTTFQPCQMMKRRPLRMPDSSRTKRLFAHIVPDSTRIYNVQRSIGFEYRKGPKHQSYSTNQIYYSSGSSTTISIFPFWPLNGHFVAFQPILGHEPKDKIVSSSFTGWATSDFLFPPRVPILCRMTTEQRVNCMHPVQKTSPLFYSKLSLSGPS
jgi:hypothetical protein